MSGRYPYECDQFGVSGSGIHLLRSGYSYKTLDFTKVDFMVIKKGKELKQWMLVLLIALLLLAFVGLDMFWLWGELTNGLPGLIFVERLLIPFLPLVLGVYMLIIALRTTTIMQVSAEGKVFHLSLYPFVKRGSFGHFCRFVKEVYPSVTIV
ncbi:hypothetical protein [Williamwhitmania taraxaci]|uniref:Uncharacterized protein n=1 Tax=Williamwhitmania taraxaci TaxID=1640674 RepID=A0A1G6I0L8_9BACT|nr:hypothetical protein [Williamwhitmania taraxaci]SDC00097.1 hypothetical protein SAMN05216323_101418 [Williamwhitmania taraxaci]